MQSLRKTISPMSSRGRWFKTWQINRWFVSSKQVIEAISRDKLVKRKEIEMSWPLIFLKNITESLCESNATQRRSDIDCKSWRDVESVDGNWWNLASFDFTVKLFPVPQNDSYWYHIISSIVDVADCLDLDQVKRLPLNFQRYLM